MTTWKLRALALLPLVALAAPRPVSAADEGAEGAAEAEASKPQMPEWASKPDLTIGDEAPSLDVEHWVQDGDGKFAEVTEFEPGKVYIVEFWATWCGPCIASMPHINKIQEDYADRGVQVISISDEPLETVTTFLERKANGEEEKTYADVTSGYCLTTDPDRSVYQQYMKAASQNGIPTAFIVGKDGVVEWIGHPMRMDEPLEQVVTDSWDRESYRKEFLIKQQLQVATSAIMAKAAEGDIEGANAMVDELVAAADSDEVKQQADGLRKNIGVRAFGAAVKSDQSKAAEMLKELAAKSEGDPLLPYQLCATVAGAAASGEVSDELLAVALETAEEAKKNADKYPGMDRVLTSIQVRLYEKQGDLDRAIELQEGLVNEADDRQKEAFQKQLDDLKKKQSDSSEG